MRACYYDAFQGVLFKLTVCARPAKFPNVTSLTLFFPASQGADTTRVYYIGFLGQFSEVCPSFFVRIVLCVNNGVSARMCRWLLYMNRKLI